MAESRLSGQYIEGMASLEANRQLATAYVEAASTVDATIVRRQLAQSYIESASANPDSTIRTLATSYMEVLVPIPPAFIGWGIPLR